MRGGVACIQKPLDDPVAERLRRQKLVEEADAALAAELFEDGTLWCPNDSVGGGGEGVRCVGFEVCGYVTTMCYVQRKPTPS